MTVEIYLAYLVTVLVFFVHPPGPSQLLFIAHSMRYDMRNAMPTMAGDLSANAIQIVIAGFGLAGLIHLSASFFFIVKWCGVGYLVWLGIRMIRSSSGHRGVAAPRNKGNLFRQGFITSSANPYAVVFFAALFPQFIDPSAPLAGQIAILGVTYLLIDGTILVLMGITAERLVGLLGGRFQIWINRLSGAFMIVAAILLALKDIAGPEEKPAR